jgi:catechol 2,3-dioxygenase-like lactoylglutathione lyase family enzyme
MQSTAPWGKTGPETGQKEGSMQRSSQVSQIARRVERLDRARDFWRETLAIPELYAFPGLAFFDLGPTRLMLRETGKRDEADTLYLATGDLFVAHQGLAAKGVSFLQPPHLIHRHPDGSEEWMAFFPDDEDRPLALHMRTAAPPISG